MAVAILQIAEPHPDIDHDRRDREEQGQKSLPLHLTGHLRIKIRFFFERRRIVHRIAGQLPAAAWPGLAPLPSSALYATDEFQPVMTAVSVGVPMFADSTMY